MSFYKRFNIEIPIDEAKERFVNQARNQICLHFHSAPRGNVDVILIVANTLGKPYNLGYKSIAHLDNYFSGNFYETLHIVENIYAEVENAGYNHKENFNTIIIELLSDSPVDLGVTWKDGKFYQKGAEELDDKLVNENLKWLSDEKYSTVRVPFEKALRHLLESHKRPELLTDCITDMYEAVEAMAKLVTGKNKELSGNAELFISLLKVSNKYKDVLKGILKGYIDYGCNYRHAGEKDHPTFIETENFIYLSGIILRASQLTT